MIFANFIQDLLQLEANEENAFFSFILRKQETIFDSDMFLQRRLSNIA